MNTSGYSFTAWVSFSPLTNGEFPMNAAILIQAFVYPLDTVSGSPASNPIAVNSTFVNTWMQSGGPIQWSTIAGYATRATLRRGQAA